MRAVQIADQPQVPAVGIDDAGLPVVTSYAELLQVAVRQLEEEEPAWSPRRREQVARGMVEAYCQGAVTRLRREPAYLSNAPATEASRTDGVVRGGLWANDLSRLERIDPSHGDCLLMETRLRAADLARVMELDVTLVRRRLKRGCRAFVAQSGIDSVVAWLWVSTDREEAPVLRRDLVFASDECYGWGAGTLPAWRGRGLFSALLRHAGLRMGQEGLRWIWGGIEDSNVASQHANAAAGYRPVVRLTAVHEPAPTRLLVRAADYADPELVRRAGLVLGLAPVECIRMPAEAVR